MRVSVAGLVVAAAALAAFAQVPAAGERFVFQPGPEAPDAQKLGAAEVAAAQKVAKAGNVADAARQLEAVATKWPASIHDCNLALAYLRASLITQAQLAWDLALLRNGSRPKWCTGEVSTQLGKALRGGNFSAVALDVTPSDALVEVAGATIRNMRTVWLPPTPVTITVSAPGMETQTLTVTPAPSARVTVALEPPKPVVVVTPDAGVEPLATPDAAVVVAPPVMPDASVLVQQPPPVEPEPQPLMRVGGTPVSYKAAALTLAVLGWVGAGVTGYLAYQAKSDANDRYPTDPQFAARQDDYDGFAVAAFGTAVIGAVATGVYIYFATSGDRVIPRPGPIRVGIGADGSIGIGYSGTFGGGGK